jgi:Beta-galactosidase/beta-glucuronidase
MGQYATLSLNGTWKLAWSDDFPANLVAPALPGRCELDAAVPAPIHQVLMDAGLLDDPRVGLNSLKARWVEENYWAYRRTFATPDDLSPATPAYLCFDRLEMNAVVYLNGAEVGRHANAHRPARFHVAGKLAPPGEENTVIVLIEAGLFDVADRPGRDYRQSPQALLTKIHWQRRGQWQRGWDWQQRLLNVGILGDVRLEWADVPLLTQVSVYALPSDDLGRATFHVRAEIVNELGAMVTGRLTATVRETGDSAQVSVAVGAEPFWATLEVAVEAPRLWWPVGHGEQPLYTVDVTLEADGEVQTVTRRTGVRKVEVDQSPHPVEGKHFTLKINDRPIFCKGGNWVPADMLYSTVPPERYRELVDVALAANFNLLRVWGGGVFADPALLDYCDEKGVLVWHDLLFACSKYPGDDPAFAKEVQREVLWAVREMAHHPSLVVWCGNNEIEEGDWHWGWQQEHRLAPHYALFHRDLPRIVTHEDPSKFYWISSPFSPDYRSPRDPTVGDQHPWSVWIGQGEPDWWAYRAYVDRFPNEGGVLGCSSPATLRQFLPEGQQHPRSPAWEHHDNPFALNGAKPGDVGRSYAMVTLWTGLDPLTLDLDRYAYVSGLLQAEGLTEYIANYRRRMFSSACAVFWMFNDSWPTTHSWTIVDWYLRRKLAFHPVRRAFAPVTVVVAADPDGGAVRAYGVNDTPRVWSGRFQAGTFGARGATLARDNEPVTLPPNAATVLHTWAQEDLTPERSAPGPFAALATDDGAPVAQHRLLSARFHELGLVRDPEIKTRLENGRLTLESDAFAWGVCLDVDGERPLADNCFDLLPGVPYVIPWDERALGEPRVLRVGNRDALPD